MALLKEVVLHNGAIANYHIISSLMQEEGKLKVIVNSYSNIEYRNKEKETYDLYNHLRELQSENTTESLAEANEILLEHPLLLTGASRWMDSNTYEIPNPVDFSYEEAYDYLKTLDVFSGAEDV